MKADLFMKTDQVPVTGQRLHQNLKEARKLKGYSQAELAGLVDVTRQTVSNWECGQSVPDVTTLKRLQQTLNIPLEQLLGNEVVQPTEDHCLSDQEVVKQLAKMTSFYAAEIERRKNRERKLMFILCIGLTLTLILLLVFKFYYYPSRIEIAPIIQETLEEKP